jgi:DNA repair protein RadC
MSKEDDIAEGLGEASPPHFHKHFERARERFNKLGGDGLEDYELLELVLHLLLPRGDTKPLAKALIDRFGNVSGVLGAAAERLAEVKVRDDAGRRKGLSGT